MQLDSTSAGPTLLGPADVRLLADRLGLRPSKRRGQNFVIDPNTIRRIVRIAEVVPGEHVLEIGPGLGSLTLGLLAAGATVTAVEVDERLAAELPTTVAEHVPAQAAGLTVVTGDALTIELSTAAGSGAGRSVDPTALVANLPYNVAVPVLLRCLEALPGLQRALVMVQREVADRLVATPGSRAYGVPSVKAAWYGDVRRAGAVGRTVFWPEPNVDSALVMLRRRPEPPSRAGRVSAFEVIDAAFGQRRKMLRSALAPFAAAAGVGPGAGPGVGAEAVLRAAGIDPEARAERLHVSDFARLADAFAAARSSEQPG